MSENTSEVRPPSVSELSDEPVIQINGMNKWFGHFHVLRDIDLTVYRNERIVICGPSGSGKSTLIRCINRLEEHQKGSIIVDEIELTDDLKQIDVASERLVVEVGRRLERADRPRHDPGELGVL